MTTGRINQVTMRRDPSQRLGAFVTRRCLMFPRSGSKYSRIYAHFPYSPTEAPYPPFSHVADTLSESDDSDHGLRRGRSTR